MRVLVEPVKHLQPGKAQVYLRPEANRLLERAIAIHGAPIYPTGSRSAGRTYADQLLLWERYQAGGPVASHPDTGPRPHMRFGALDISDEGARRAMLRAGWLATESSEWWHFEHPDCRDWPIVTDPYTADGGLTRRSTSVTLYYCTTTDKPSTRESPQPIQMYALAGESPGTSANWLETNSASVATGWASAHGSAVFLTRSSFAAFRDRYLEPLRIAGGTAGDDGEVLTALAQVPAKTVDELKARL